MADSDSDVESVDSTESDKELQVAFSQGLLKPGLNVEAPAPRKAINDVEGMRAALAELRSDLPWVERLDITLDPPPAHKALELQENVTLSTSEDNVHDDFKREMKFYRQAQAAVLVSLPRLQKMGIPTCRPNDYFAEMAKTDIHMKKVREKLLAKQMSMERSEKAKKLRELRKYGKKVQQDVLLRRQKEKKEMMDAVKKYRKGQKSGLDFLDDTDKKGPNQGKGMQQNKKRMHKNKRYGFGGQKKRSKHNTAASAKDMSDFNAKKHSTRPGKVNKKSQKGNKNKPTRPGKSKRKGMKNRK